MITITFLFLLLGLFYWATILTLNQYLPLWHTRGYRRGISKAVATEAKRLNLGLQRILSFLSLKAVY